jgi:hypothetical protein
MTWSRRGESAADIWMERGGGGSVRTGEEVMMVRGR